MKPKRWVDLIPTLDIYVENCTRRKSLPQVTEFAELVGMTRFALTRCCRAETGMTPLAFMKRDRVSRAIALLQTTDLSIAEVAARAGFGTERNLHRVLTTTTGKPPSRFRSGGKQRR